MTNPPFVFEPNPESLEAAARKLFDLQAGKSEIPWVYLPELEKKHWRTKAASTITAYMAAEHAAGRALIRNGSVIFGGVEFDTSCPVPATSAFKGTHPMTNTRRNHDTD
jgi:hypothetical protein